MQDIDVARHGIELRLCAKYLKGSACAVFISNAGIGAQLAQAITAVFRQTHHAFFVDAVTRCGAVAQHLHHPLRLVESAVGTDGQGGVLLKQPFHGFERNAWRCPRRGVARGDLTCIGKTGFFRCLWLPVNHRDIHTRAGQVISRGDSDHATSQNDGFHELSLFCTMKTKFMEGFAVDFAELMGLLR